MGNEIFSEGSKEKAERPKEVAAVINRFMTETGFSLIAAEKGLAILMNILSVKTELALAKIIREDPEKFKEIFNKQFNRNGNTD